MVTIPEQKKKFSFLNAVIYLSLITGSICHGLWSGSFIRELTADIMISLLLAVLQSRFLQFSQRRYHCRIQDRPLVAGAYLIANIMLGLGAEENFGFFWFLPVAMVAVSSGLELAFSVYTILLLQNMLFHTDFLSDSAFMAAALFGIACVLMFSIQAEPKAFPYLCVILFCLDGILQVLRNEFLFSGLVKHRAQILLEAVSVILLEAVLWGYFCYRQKNGRKTEDEKNRTRYLQKSLARVLEADYGLLLRLQEYSGALFIHSMRVSSVSARATRHLGGNHLLAQAGGMYHELGRIADQEDYIEAGIELAKDNDFPEELIAMIREHSTGYERPKSMEAAIIMLTDCIISTSEYLEKVGHRKQVSDEKLVNSIFQNRLEKGNLEESGLTAEQIEKLRNFYIKQVFLSETGLKEKMV